MTTAVEAVLRRHGYAISEDTLAAHLDVLLSGPHPGSVGIDMSAVDAAYLTEYSGVRDASDAALAALDARSAGRVAAEAGRSLTRNDVAALLGVDPSRVSHQVTAGTLYTYAGRNGRPVFPDWQFITAAVPTKIVVLPHLAAVVAAIPIGSHPVAVRAFMTTANSDLAVQGMVLAPREWLRTGGDPTDVTDLAVTLGEQV